MIQISTYAEEYKDDIIRLIVDVYEHELGFVGYNRPDIYAIAHTYQQDQRSNFWIALDNKKLVGTVAVLAKTEDVAYVKRMVIKKEYRQKGLGKKLLQTALTFAKKQGFKKLYAGTVPENPNAIQFYKYFGFVECEDIPEDITAAHDSVCLKFDL